MEAHKLNTIADRIIATLAEPVRARIPPFDDIELDLAYILGD